MDEKTKQPKVIVERRYRYDEMSCQEAIRLLLDAVKPRRKGGEPPAAPDDDAKESRHGAATGSIPRRK